MRVAVVDIGSNSTRLLIADVDPATRALAEVERRSIVTRLGEGVDAGGALGDAPQERVFTVLGQYADAIAEHGAERSTAVMTSAVRDASNGARFAAAVRERFGLEGRTLSGDEEAQLTFRGATAAVTRSRSDSGIAWASAGRTSSPSARSSRGLGGSECRWRSEWRTTPTWVETWKATVPLSPITSSVEPPPMSITSSRSPGSSPRAAVAPR